MKASNPPVTYTATSYNWFYLYGIKINKNTAKVPLNRDQQTDEASQIKPSAVSVGVSSFSRGTKGGL